MSSAPRPVLLSVPHGGLQGRPGASSPPLAGPALRGHRESPHGWTLREGAGSPWPPLTVHTWPPTPASHHSPLREKTKASLEPSNVGRASPAQQRRPRARRGSSREAASRQLEEARGAGALDFLRTWRGVREGFLEEAASQQMVGVSREKQEGLFCASCSPLCTTLGLPPPAAPQPLWGSGGGPPCPWGTSPAPSLGGQAFVFRWRRVPPSPTPLTLARRYPGSGLWAGSRRTSTGADPCRGAMDPPPGGQEPSR